MPFALPLLSLDWPYHMIPSRPWQEWANALGIAFVAWGLLTLFRGVIVRRLEGIAARTDTLVDDLAIALIKSVRKSYVALAALCISLLSVWAPDPAPGLLKWITLLVLLAQGLRTGFRLVDFWAEHYASQRGGADQTTLTALRYGLRGIVFILLLVLALEAKGENIRTLLTGLGIGGIAIALAVQNILGDLFGALSIVLDKPFIVGDTIAVDQFEGTVEHIGLKTTRLRSVNGELVVISNADLLRSRVRNLSRREGRRLLFVLSIAHGTAAAALARVPSIITGVIADERRAQIQHVHLVGMGAIGFDIEIAIIIPRKEFDHALEVRQAILLEAYARLESEGIALARGVNALPY